MQKPDPILKTARRSADAEARERCATRAAMDEAVTVAVSHEPPPWDAYLGRRGEEALFAQPAWGAVMEEAYGNRPYYLTARRGEATVGVLQLVLQRSLLFGTHLCSLPYLDASGILADDAEAAGALAREAERLRGETRAKWAELRHLGPVVASLASRTDKVTLHLALPADADALWTALDAKVRNQVRKAEREGLTVQAGGAECVEEFCGVYERTMRDLGSPPHSRRFFRLLAERFAGAARVFLVRHEGRTAAASFTLTGAGAVHVPWAASDWRLRRLNANMLLYWHMLKDACERGLRRFDFGRSTRDSGTHKFKRQWGAEEVPLVWQYVLAPGGEAPDVRPDSPKYRLLVALWRRLPVGVARRLGPRVIARLS